MLAVLRSILSVFVGFVVASIVMMLVETVNGKVLFPGLGESAQGVTDREKLREILANAPVGAFLVVIFGWILGSIVGGFTTAKIASREGLTQVIVLGYLLTLAGVANNLMIPPPEWFWILSVPLLSPSTYLGGRLATQRSTMLNQQK